MKFGTEKKVFSLDTKGSTLATITKVRKGEVEKVMRHYRIRVHVRSPQEEMTEYMRFTDEINRFHKNGTLTHDKEDNSTKPAFIIEYPKENLDGSYFIIKNYCVFDIH